MTSIQTNSPANRYGRPARAKPAQPPDARRWGARGLGAAGVLCAAATAGAVLTVAMPSAAVGAAATPSAAATRPPTSAECLKEFGVACYSPQQLQRAYNLAPLYAKGFDGKGRTIVIIDPFGSPTLAKDLATFDSALGVAAPSFPACIAARREGTGLQPGERRDGAKGGRNNGRCRDSP